MRQCGVRAVEEAVEVRSNDAIPVCDVHLFNRTEAADPRVIYQDVQAAKAGDGSVDNALTIFGTTHVRSNTDRFTIARSGYCSGSGVAVFLMTCGDDDVATMCSQRFRDGAANATRGAGNDRGFPFKISHGREFNCCSQEPLLVFRMNLSGKTALVTGGARRVGRALSIALGRAGADVVVNYHNSSAEADDTVRELQSSGVRASSFRADVSQKRDIDALIEHVRREHGALHILVNNASRFDSAPFAEITEADWRRVLDVNLTGPFLLSQAAAPLLHKSEAPNIINILDLSALQPWPSYAHHSVSKAGLLQLTKVMARALAPAIRVNAIAPGTVLPPDGYDGTAGDGTTDRRLVEPAGSPDDVVQALFYLIESQFVTGQVLVVDGGRMLL